LRVDDKQWRVCLDFFSSDPETQDSYEKAIPQEYIGYRVRNLADGYVAEDENGKPILRCGSKDRLETTLLIIAKEKEPGRIVNT
jgi:hypothetical protein